jgi:hypothetical protein
MIRVVLFLASLFRGALVRWGVDYDKMVVLLRYQLLVDGRTSRAANKRRNHARINHARLHAGLAMLFTGTLFFFLFYFKFAPDTATLLLFFHAMLLFTMATNLMHEYNDMLFNPRDGQILSRLPLDARTMWAARIARVACYFLFYALCSVVIPVLFCGIKYGVLFALALLLAGVCNMLFSLLLVNLICLLLLRFLSVERFQGIMHYVQVAMAIGMLALYLVVTYAGDAGSINASLEGWRHALPPAWFAAFNEVLARPDGPTVARCLAGIVVPLLALYTSARWFVPYFSRRSGEMTLASYYRARRSRQPRGAGHRLASLFTFTPLSRAGFRFAWRASSGDKYFKGQVLSIIFTTFLIVGYQLYNAAGTRNVKVACIVSLYVTCLAVISLVDGMQYTRSGNLFWFYRVRPLARPGLFLLGAFKGIYVKYFLPLYLVTGAITVYLAGSAMLIHVACCFCTITCFAMLFMCFHAPAFPFSRERESSGLMKSIFYFMAFMVVAGGMGLLQSYLSTLPRGMYIATSLLAACTLACAIPFRHLSWRRIERRYKS